MARSSKKGPFVDESLLTKVQNVKDGSKSVADHLKSVNADLKVIEFKRVALG